MEVHYTKKLRKKDDLFSLYERLEWNTILQMNPAQIAKAMEHSWRVIYVYHQETLVGTGRVISDGMINAYLCGIGVDPAFQDNGIGKEICKRLIGHCEKHGLHVQLLCEDRLIPYYQKMGFEVFAVGMKLQMLIG